MSMSVTKWHMRRKDPTTPTHTSDTPTSEPATPESATPTPTVHVLPVDLFAPGDDDHTEPFELCLEESDLRNVLDALCECLYIRRPTLPTPTAPDHTHATETSAPDAGSMG